MLVLGCLVAGAAAFLLADRRGHGDARGDQENGPHRARIAHGLDGIRTSKQLVVLTLEGPTTYFNKDGQILGYDAELAAAMAAALDAGITYRTYDAVPALLEAIEAGEGHIAAASLTRRERADTTALSGPAYKNIRVQVVCRRGDSLPGGMSELTAAGDIAVVAGSAADDTLRRHAPDAQNRAWRRYEASSPLPILRQVSDGAQRCAAAESHQIALARRHYPDLVTAFSLTEDDRQLAWLIAPQSADLEPWLKEWFAGLHESGYLAALDERYYGHLSSFDWFDIAKLRDRIDSRLPRYESEFRRAAGAQNLDWTLLAAQAYQESHWDPDAVSPTGVRGMMMLTRPTARELGVRDRTDPGQSIDGGARYLDRLYERLPEDVTGYDRLWMSMAAYNVGYGHLLDARRLAQRTGRDPDQWHVIDDTLPLLSQKKYYSTVPHGYARGSEPVTYVRKIREYDEVLTANVSAPEHPPFLLRRPVPERAEKESAAPDSSPTDGQ